MAFPRCDRIQYSRGSCLNPDVRAQRMKTTATISLLLLALAMGCGMKNIRQYDKGNIRLCSSHWQKSGYISLRIGTPTQPYGGSPALLLKMSDGTTINSATVDMQTLSDKCAGKSDASGNLFADIGTPSLAPGATWPQGTMRLQDQARVFMVQGGRLLSISMGWNPNGSFPSPEVSAPDKQEWVSFPLKEENAIALFGEADAISEHPSE